MSIELIDLSNTPEHSYTSCTDDDRFNVIYCKRCTIIEINSLRQQLAKPTPEDIPIAQQSEMLNCHFHDIPNDENCYLHIYPADDGAVVRMKGITGIPTEVYEALKKPAPEAQILIDALRKIAMNKYSGISTASLPPIDQRALWAEQALYAYDTKATPDNGVEK